MGTINKFDGSSTRLLDPANSTLDGQARVNAEIFTAVEILGRKLERAEGERDALARRLALIESSATVDEKTGKIYLPVMVNPQDLPQARDAAAPKWMVAASLMSSVVAMFSLGLVLFHAPQQLLTKEELAALDSLRGPSIAQIAPESKGWQKLPEEPAAENTLAATATAVPAQQSAAAAPAQQSIDAPAQLPGDSELVKLEQSAVAPSPAPAQETAMAPAPETVITPAPSTVPPALEEAKTAEIKTPPQTENKKPENKTAKKAPVTETKNAVADADMAPDTALPKKLQKLQQRAYQGIPEAQHDLATLYAAGADVPQDYQRAAFWFTKAAEGGIANAHYNMGVIYHQGLGVPVDLPKALEWYEKAAELGHPEAMYNLGISYIEGIGTKADITKGVSYFKRAANAGVVQAAYNLGVLYESNFIGPIDTKKAIEWYRVAAKQGHVDAKAALARLQGGTAVSQSAVADEEETGEGDASPVSENTHAQPAVQNGLLADTQRILIKRGSLPGTADGIMNQQTEDAIRAFQKKTGLKQDGLPSPELLEKLLQAPPTVE